jgi:S-formylglutathione hydrolase FrmB
MKNLPSELTENSWINPFKSQVPGLFHKTFYSNCMKRDIGYAIYLPPNYLINPQDGKPYTGTKIQENKQFPVIYWLHGKGGDESTGYNIRIAAILHKEITEGSIKPVIMVFPNCGNFSMFCDSYDGTIMGETILIKELIPFIDANYRTIPSAEGRALEGFSMGGFGAVKLAFKYPGMFCSVAAIAGSFHDLESVSKNRPEVYQHMFGANGSYFNSNSPYILAEKNTGLIKRNLKLKFVNGSNDFTIENNYKLNRHLDSLGIDYEFKQLEGFKHIPGPYYEKEGLECHRFHMKNFGLM